MGTPVMAMAKVERSIFCVGLRVDWAKPALAGRRSTLSADVLPAHWPGRTGPRRSMRRTTVPTPPSPHGKPKASSRLRRPRQHGFALFWFYHIWRV